MSQALIVTTPQELRQIVTAAVEQALSSVKAVGTAASGRRYVSEEEAASILGTTASSLRTRRCRGKGPAYSKDGGRVVYDVRDIEAHMQAAKVKTRES